MSDDKILWISRNQPLSIQKKRLREQYGDDTGVVVKNIGNASEISDEFESGGYRDLVFQGPLATLDHILQEGLYPLWAEMSEEPIEDREPDLSLSDGRQFWFDRFERVIGLKLETEPSDEDSEVEKVLRLTRHSPSQAELDTLQQLFGEEVKVQTGRDQLKDADDAKQRFHSSDADELLMQAPYSIYRDLCGMGINPLRPEYKDGEFIKLVRVTGFEKNTDPL